MYDKSEDLNEELNLASHRSAATLRQIWNFQSNFSIVRWIIFPYVGNPNVTDLISLLRFRAIRRESHFIDVKQTSKV